MTAAVEFFERTIQEKGYFFYLPESVSEGLLNGTLDDIECLDLPGPWGDNRWEKISIPDPTKSRVKELIVSLYKLRKEPSLRVTPDLQDRLQWGEIYQAFNLIRKDGYLCLSNGVIIEFLSANISFGTLHAPGGCAYTDYHSENSHLIVLKNSFTKSRVTRLMRLTREHLHQVRCDNPTKIIEIARNLGLLK